MKQEEISVGLGDRSYVIKIGDGILPDIGEELKAISFPGRVAIVSNARISGLYGQVVIDSLEKYGFKPDLILVPEGEEYKSLAVLETIFDQLIGLGYDRSTGLVALGGGVIGDMAGFAASTFLRGIPFVQVPTTLLSQVDSSVGGKTAVNHKLGKNLIGAFYQPKLVLIDVETLKTLEKRELAAGMAEVVKYGVIRDSAFFDWLEIETANLLNLDRNALIYAIKRSCQIKADIVEIDEREGSLRAILNYGHTFGHAIEALAGYGEWRHGEAVAIGMVVAAKISRDFDLCNDDDLIRLIRILKSLELPVTPPDFALDAYIEAMLRDKKMRDGSLTLVLNRGIGDTLLKKVSDLSTIFLSVLEPQGE